MKLAVFLVDYKKEGEQWRRLANVELLRDACDIAVALAKVREKEEQITLKVAVMKGGRMQMVLGEAPSQPLRHEHKRGADLFVECKQRLARAKADGVRHKKRCAWIEATFGGDVYTSRNGGPSLFADDEFRKLWLEDHFTAAVTRAEALGVKPRNVPALEGAPA